MAEQTVGSGWTADVYTHPAFGSAQMGEAARGHGGGSGGGEGGGTMEDDTKTYVDAQVDKTRAQNDARFAEVLAKLDILQQTSASWRSVWGAAMATFVAIGGLWITVMALEGDRFESGIAARDTITAVIQPIVDAQKERDAEQDRKLDRILRAVERSSDQPQESPSQGQN